MTLVRAMLKVGGPSASDVLYGFLPTDMIGASRDASAGRKRCLAS